jgi:hypothetical protein
MTRSVTSGPGILRRLAHFRLRNPAPEVRSLAESAWGIPDERATGSVPEIQPFRSTSSTPECLDHRAELLDAVAGSEFVDDRIRLRE